MLVLIIKSFWRFIAAYSKDNLKKYIIIFFLFNMTTSIIKQKVKFIAIKQKYDQSAKITVKNSK